MKFELPIFFVSALVLAALCFVSCRKSPTAIHAADANLAKEAEAIVVTADELLASPSKYSGRLVRVTGYWISAFEYSALHATPEITAASPIWVEQWGLPGGRQPKNPTATAAAVKAAYKADSSSRSRKRDVLLVTVEGYFDHLTAIPVTKESYPFPSGFGHLGQYVSQLTIERVVAIKLVSEEDMPI